MTYAISGTTSKEEFIEKMNEQGWKVFWTDDRKNITFQNGDGKKVRNTNLEKKFKIKCDKETLLNEFERAKDNKTIREYFSEIDDAIEREGISREAIEVNKGIGREDSHISVRH